VDRDVTRDPDRGTIGILVVEDHPVMRRMIEDYLGTETGMAVHGSVASAEEALRKMDENGEHAELALIDTSLPGMNGIELVRELTARHPRVRCVMYSGHAEPDYVKRALAEGAKGYILKDGSPSELPEGIRRVVQGEVYLSEPLRPAPREG
jgi:DNA-binding NarL/FixJ family response regulator